MALYNDQLELNREQIDVETWRRMTEIKEQIDPLTPRQAIQMLLRVQRNWVEVAADSTDPSDNPVLQWLTALLRAHIVRGEWVENGNPID